MRYIEVDPRKSTAVISVGKAYRLTVIKAVESEMQAAYSQGIKKVTVDLQGTMVLTSAAIKQLARIRKHVLPENFSVMNAKGWALTSLLMANLEGWLAA